MLCVTGGERDPDALRRRIQAAPELMHEVRLDLLEHVDDEALSLLASDRVIATCRSRAQGGGFGGDEAARLALLERALARQPGYLDVEGELPAEVWQTLSTARGNTRLIASFHRFQPTPPGELARLLEHAPPQAALLKLAVAVEDAADLLPLLDLARGAAEPPWRAERSAQDMDARPLIRIGMGPAGLLSRALYRRFGSPWTYVVPAGAAPLAPGQLDLAQARAWRLDRELTPLALVGGPQVLDSPGPRVYNALFRARSEGASLESGAERATRDRARSEGASLESGAERATRDRARRDLPFVYLPVVSRRAAEVLELLERLGFAGISVTMPLKQEFAVLVGHNGPVNTLVRTKPVDPPGGGRVGTGWRSNSARHREAPAHEFGAPSERPGPGPAAAQLALRRSHTPETPVGTEPADPPGEWTAHNTDVDALQALLSPHVRPGSGTATSGALRSALQGGSLAPRALVLGAGGAARAAASVLKRLGYATAICSRDDAKATAVARELDLATEAWEARGQHAFDLLVNATPLGSDGVSDPMPPDVTFDGRLVLDAVIGPTGSTPLIRRARSHCARSASHPSGAPPLRASDGARTFEGIDWWLHQGARQMTLITGEPISVEELGLELHPAIDDASHPVVIRVPGSKSVTQRALLLAALAPGTSWLRHPLDCDDSRVLRGILRTLGVAIIETPDGWRIEGGLTAMEGPQALDCGEAGSALRFTAPLSLLVDAPLTLDGSPRLRLRPLTPLLDALERLGVEATFVEAPGRLPVQLLRRAERRGLARVRSDARNTRPRAERWGLARVRSDARAHGRAPLRTPDWLPDSARNTRPRGAPPRETWIDATHSSQFLSGLLMAAPCLPHALHLQARTAPGAPMVSRPYVALTLQIMQRFGVTVDTHDDTYRVPSTPYRPCDFTVEGDWSGAAFLLAAAHLTGRPVQLLGLSDDSAQGDRVFVQFIDELRRPRSHRFDLAPCPDLIAPLAAAAVRSPHPVQLVGVAHARLKESDRIAVLARGLQQAGVRIEEQPDGLTILPGGALHPARLDPAGDHRMAMAFGLLSLLEPGVEVLDHDCVNKSFPAFWHELERLR